MLPLRQPYRSTPSLRSRITHLTVNPTWNCHRLFIGEGLVSKKFRDDYGLSVSAEYERA